MSDKNALLEKIRRMKSDEAVRSSMSSDFYHSEDTYALIIATVNMALENAQQVRCNIEVLCPIPQHTKMEYHMDYMGRRIPVASKAEAIDIQWGYQSVASLSEKYAVIHLMAKSEQHAMLIHGHGEYLPLTPDNFVPEIFQEIPDTMMFWEQESVDLTYNADAEMDKLFKQLDHYVQRKPGVLNDILGYNNYGFGFEK